MKRIVLALVIPLVLSGGCYTRSGKLDAGSTMVLAAGVAALGGLIYLGSSNSECEDPYGRCENYNIPPPPPTSPGY